MASFDASNGLLSPAPSAEPINGEGCNGSRTGFQAGGAKHSRVRTVPAPISVSQPYGNGGGQILMTPATSTMPVKYQLPEYTEPACDHGHGNGHAHSHAHAAAHAHDGSADKSFLTRLILDSFTEWPLLHAIVVEKDSRRIFYFMWYVPSPLITRTTADEAASTSRSWSSRASTATSPTRWAS